MSTSPDFRPSQSIQAIKPSATSAAAQRARELRAEGKDILSLTTGEPDFEIPLHVRQAVQEAVARNDSNYTATGGIDALKSAIVDKFRRENGLDYATSEVMASSGAKQVIFNAFLATLDPGDEVIVPSPCWVTYPDVARLAGAEPVIVETGAAEGFLLTPDRLETAITPRTRWLVLNAPSNPSGAIYSRARLAALGEVLERHPQVWILSDDIYEHIRYDGAPYDVLAAVCPALKARTLSVNGISKAFAATGWRLGYCGGPAPLIAQMTKLQSQSTGNPSTLGQAAALAALTGPMDFLAPVLASYQKRRDRLVARLNAMDGLSCATPAGAFYVFPDCSGLLGRKRPEGTVLTSDWDVVSYLLSGGVATVHGAAFACSPHFRISFATEQAVLDSACDRIEASLAALS
ncbi:aminotransferase class I/II-fold pyridoxal phosphate-dependent enzyme [Salipiger abyssi]|uniref:aminotransferase class I/II-fold pyridoxal phosphate-dependent enzyme n=1 Tax=Salipiger abyssi TaxID=1250539 RepID=UPI001A909F03|nr:aminotransferase class I/II-fold pyridoxal phosphate-dependent enzyme [Salipiger abyssi]MBN9890027.1 aminotransferase class I/II-fold pyridoxal phosphate-dependent enzyme [Salipiger abyssi]